MAAPSMWSRRTMSMERPSRFVCRSAALALEKRCLRWLGCTMTAVHAVRGGGAIRWHDCTIPTKPACRSNIFNNPLLADEAGTALARNPQYAMQLSPNAVNAALSQDEYRYLVGIS